MLVPSLSVIEIPFPTEFSEAVSTPGWTPFISLITSWTVVAPVKLTLTDVPSRRSMVISGVTGFPLESVVLKGTPCPEFKLLSNVEPVIVRMPRSVAVVPPFSPMEKFTPLKRVEIASPLPAALIPTSRLGSAEVRVLNRSCTVTSCEILTVACVDPSLMMSPSVVSTPAPPLNADSGVSRVNCGSRLLPVIVAAALLAMPRSAAVWPPSISETETVPLDGVICNASCGTPETMLTLSVPGGKAFSINCSTSLIVDACDKSTVSVTGVPVLTVT